MHFYFFARGIQHQIDMWKIHSQCIFWKWKRVNLKTGKEEQSLVQGALRPTIFGAYEYVFPRECLAEVCKVMGVCSDIGCYYKHIGFTKLGMKARHLALRKIFNCKKIPKKIFKEAESIPGGILLENSWRGLSSGTVGSVAIHPIGIKEDIYGELGDYYQELL